MNHNRLRKITTQAFIVLIAITSFDVVAIYVNPNLPRSDVQMPESHNAFDSFDQEDTINWLYSASNGTQDDLDVSIPDNLKNPRKNNLIMLAVLQKDISTIRDLLQAGGKENAVVYRNYDGQTALHYAAMKNNSQIIELLLKNNAPINVCDKLNRTPLHFAVENDSFEAVKTLLHYGANVSLRDNDDKTPMDYADNDAMKNILSRRHDN